DDKFDAFGGGSYKGLQPMVSPDGKLVVFTYFDTPRKTVKVRDVATTTVVKVLGDDKITHFHKIAFTPNGDTLYALVHLSGENVLTGWRVADWQQVCHIKIPKNQEPSSLFPVADGKTVMTIMPTRPPADKAQIDIFDVRQQKHVRSIVLPYKNAGPFAVSPDGKMLAVVGDDGELKKGLDVFNLDDGQQVCRVLASKNVSDRPEFPVDGFP